MNTPFTGTCQTSLACLVLFLMINGLKMAFVDILLRICGN
jgi:hypothetical protein